MDGILGVLIVDDDGGLRELVALVLRMQPGFDVVGEAASAAEAVRKTAEAQPDVIVLDLGLPDLRGTEVLPDIRAACPAARIVIFTGSDDADQQVGIDAAAYITKGDVSVLVDVLAGFLPTARRTAEVALPAEPTAARSARDFVRSRLEAWGCRDAIADNVLLVTSELVTNAVVHARSPARLRLMHDDVVLRVEVEDGSEASPRPRAPGIRDAGGRGLHIIGELARAWGVDPRQDGKVVWAELGLS